MNDARPLTPRQKEVFDFVCRFSRDYGYSPTYGEIGEALGLSSSATIYNHIKALEKKGYIKKQKNVSRGIQILVEDEGQEDAKKQVITVPILGSITGLSPLKEQVPEEKEVHVPRRHVGAINPEKCYILKVEGNELASEGLLSEDYVLFEYTEEIEYSQAFLVIMEEEIATIRKIQPHEQGVKLESHTHPLHNRVVKKANVHGKVLAVLRFY